MNQELLEKCKNADLLKEVAKGKEVVWINENLEKTEDAMAKINITMADIDDAEARLARFAPFLMKKFPETIPTNGLIESPLTYIPNMQKKLEEHIQVDDERNANLLRTQILRFNDELIDDKHHTREHFIEILAIIDAYEDYCRSHPDYKNNRCICAVANIKRVYNERLQKHDFS